MVTPFDMMLYDVSKFRSPAKCMPRHAVVRSPSAESDHDIIMNSYSMVAKAGVPLALDPKQFIFLRITNMFTFWFPFQQHNPLRTIKVYADRWNTDREFECVFCPPILRDNSQTICYNGGCMQPFRLVHVDRKLVALRTCGGYQTSDPPPQHTFEIMAEVFLLYVQSASLA